MRIKAIIYIILIFIAWGCRVQMVPDAPRQTTCRFITNYKDSFSRAGRRIVFSKVPCDSLKLLDSRGNKIQADAKDTNRPYYYCSEHAANTRMLYDLKYKNEMVGLMFYGDGSMALNTSKCSKYLHRVIEKWGDSIPVVMWHEVSQSNGTFQIYMAEESWTFPFYKASTMDSLVFSFTDLCTAKDLEEEKMYRHNFYEKNMKVHVSPNPFHDDFEFTLECKNSTFFFFGVKVNLGFYDDKGNPLLTKIIEPYKTYTFSFPEISSGKTIYYRVSMEDYVISGQVLKN